MQENQFHRDTRGIQTLEWRVCYSAYDCVHDLLLSLPYQTNM
jgi:hypothetical protein